MVHFTLGPEGKTQLTAFLKKNKVKYYELRGENFADDIRIISIIFLAIAKSGQAFGCVTHFSASQHIESFAIPNDVSDFEDQVNRMKFAVYH